MTPTAPHVDSLPMWTPRLLLADAGVVQEQNVLRIEAQVEWAGEPLIGNFTIDNAVVFYKTAAARTRPARPAESRE
jgi:hypothetical protein